MFSSALCPRMSPSCSCLSRRFWDWKPRPFLSCHFCSGPQIFCMCHLRAESLFLLPSGSHESKPSGLDYQHFGGFFSWCKIPRLASLIWGLDSLLLGENHCKVVITLPFSGLATQRHGSYLYHMYTPPVWLIVIYSSYL